MPPPTIAPMMGPMNGSGMATTAPMAAAIAVRLATGFSNISRSPYVYYMNNTLALQGWCGVPPASRLGKAPHGGLQRRTADHRTRRGGADARPGTRVVGG